MRHGIGALAIRFPSSQRMSLPSESHGYGSYPADLVGHRVQGGLGGIECFCRIAHVRSQVTLAS
jgi:hypothetical protein